MKRILELARGLELLEELFGARAGPRVDGQLHVADLLVDVLHERDYKVDELVPVHLLGMEVGDEEADVVVLQSEQKASPRVWQR